MYKIGLLGYGKMGSSIIGGIINAKIYNKTDILIYSPNKEDVISAGFKYACNELEVFENSEILIFAIKPQGFPAVMQKLKGCKNAPKIVVSIAAGITIKYLKENLGDLKYIRIMPNLGASIKMAVSTMAVGENVSVDEKKMVKDIFDSIGSTSIVKEEDINTLLPLNGSYPAYFWYFVRSFVRAASKAGVSEEVSRKILADASIGCAKMLNDSSKDLDTLINDVCSYKGTTIEGVYVFDDSNLDEIVEKAAQACTKRAYELEK